MLGIITSVIGSVVRPIVDGYVKVQTTTVNVAGQTSRAFIRGVTDERTIKFANWMGRSPLWIMEAGAAIYVATIFWDSVGLLREFVYFNALKLPEWFIPYFDKIFISIVGLAAWRRSKWGV